MKNRSSPMPVLLYRRHLARLVYCCGISREAVATVLQHTLGDAAALQQLAIERKKRLAELSYERIRGQVEADLQGNYQTLEENH